MRGMMLIVLAWGSLFPGASHAGTGGEEDRMVVNRLNDTDFEVVETVRMEPQGYWCGAATLLERREGQPQSTPIYLMTPLGPSETVPGRDAVRFTTDASAVPRLNRQPNTVDVSRPGRMLKSYQARRFCRDAFTRSTK